MTTASAKTSSVLPLIITAAIAVAGWASYLVERQDTAKLQQQTDVLASKLETKDKEPQGASPTKPPKAAATASPKAAATASPKAAATASPKAAATASPKSTATVPPKAVATKKPPKKYNKLLMAEREKALNEKDAAQARIGTILKQKESVQDEGKKLRQQLVMSTENIKKLKQKLEEVSSDIQKVREQEADRFSKLKQRFEHELEQNKITISELKNSITVINVTAEILFTSGSATIKPKGQEVLDLIAETLNSHPNRMISIEGHTDNVQVIWDSQYPTNWELSAARSAAAVRYLGDKAGVTENRMQVVGHGEQRPTASNATAEGRATNRRIEIVLLPPSGQ